MADNKVIRTTVLDLTSYLAADTKLIVQRADGTFKASWSTVSSVLTATLYAATSGIVVTTTPPPTTPPPTTPSVTIVTTPPPTTAPIPTVANPLVINFGETGGSFATINTAGHITIIVSYYYPGQPSDYVDFHVTKSSVETQWANNQPVPPSANFGTSSLWNSAYPGYAGPGVYTFKCIARRTSTGSFDTFSNDIILTVTA